MNAKSKALSLLNNRDKTEYEMRDSLRKAGFDGSDVDATIEYLKDMKYIDDESYAYRFIEMCMEKKRGPYRMRRDLKSRGVAPPVIEDAIYELVTDDWEWNTAEALVNDIKYKNSDLRTDKLLAKIVNKLSYEGFSDYIVNDVVYSLYDDENDMT
jgi:regulatory protein